MGMKSTILSRELLQEALDHYNEFKHLNFVVPNSLPILKIHYIVLVNKDNSKW